MVNQQNETDIPHPRRRGRLIRLGWIAALIIGLMVIGAIYESRAEASDAKTYPPPGQLVDVEGYRLHINCTGTGSPTVVIDSGQAALARFGIARLLVKLPAIATSMPAGQEAYYPLYVRPQSLQTADNELQGIPASLAQADAVKTFGDLPLIVLTGKLNDRQEWQTELLQLSSTSQQVFAENSGHIIQVDEPEAAVAAILQMVEQVRQSIKSSSSASQSHPKT
jgi:hypothetical protein